MSKIELFECFDDVNVSNTTARFRPHGAAPCEKFSPSAAPCMQGAALGDDFRTVQRRAIRTVPQSAKIFLHGAAPCEKCCLMLRHAKTFLHGAAPCKTFRTVLLRAKKLCLIQAKFLRTVQHRAKNFARCRTVRKKFAWCCTVRKI